MEHVPKFKVGDMVTTARRVSATVANVIGSAGMDVYGSWGVGLPARSFWLDNCYVVVDGCGTNWYIPFIDESTITEDKEEENVPKFKVGDFFSRHHGGNANSGQYEVVEIVYGSRRVTYDWSGSSRHPRECEDSYVVRIPGGEFMIISFSENAQLTAACGGSCSCSCPRCGEQMVKKNSHGLIGGAQFEVKKCVKCGYCC